jgi:hypothetical protein
MMVLAAATRIFADRVSGSNNPVSGGKPVTHARSAVNSGMTVTPVIGPVEATSQAFIENWTKKPGHPVDAEMARQLAADAVTPLRQRLNNGGKKTPAFRHLKGEERSALFSYLQILSVVTSREFQPVLVTESVARVGEHLAKGPATYATPPPVPAGAIWQ